MTSDSDPTPRTRDTVGDPFEGPGWPQERRTREYAAGNGAGAGERTRTRVRERVRRRKGLARLIRRRRARRTGKRSTARRALVWGLGIVVVLVVLGVAWLVYSSLRVRSDLQAVRAGVHEMRVQLTAGDLTAARHTAASIRSHAQSAHNLTGGPVWAVAANLPAVGNPFATARAVTSSVRMVADGAVAPLVGAIDTFQPGTLRTPSGAFNIAAIDRVVPTLGKADRTLAAAIRQLRHASGSTWLSPVNHARNAVLDQLTPLSRDVAQLHRAVAVVPTVLGADGPRTYMVTFQNDAEIRATGGLPGAFAIVRTDHGKVEFTHFESDNYLARIPAPGAEFGPKFSYLFSRAHKDYRDSNYSPNFPYAARIWASLYQQKAGPRLDGALVVDPTALQYLLQVSGPVTLPDGETLTAGNVVDTTEHELYLRYGRHQKARKRFLLDMARAISTKVLSPGMDSGRLLPAAARAAAEHRLLFWSRDRNVEKELATVPLGGVVPTAKQPYVALALDNREAGKLGYYLHASMAWKRTGCGPTRDVTVTVKLTNDAPPNLPRYVLGTHHFLSLLPHSFPPGTLSLDTYLYGSVGGTFTSVKATGGIAFRRSGQDRGHPVYEANVEVPPQGKSVTVVFHLKEPAWSGPVVVRDQPLINPMTTTVSDAHC